MQNYLQNNTATLIDFDIVSDPSQLDSVKNTTRNNIINSREHSLQPSLIKHLNNEMRMQNTLITPMASSITPGNLDSLTRQSLNFKTEY